VLVLARDRLRVELALAAGVLGLLVTQMIVGEIQWRTELPWGVVLLHVALGTAVWVGVVALAARLLAGSRARLP
jgi:heme A synthase